MNEVILVTSSKDSGGFGAFDLRTGGVVATFKNCCAETGSVCLLGGSSSYSGLGTLSGLAFHSSFEFTLLLTTLFTRLARILCGLHRCCAIEEARHSYLRLGETPAYYAMPCARDHDSAR